MFVYEAHVLDNYGQYEVLVHVLIVIYIYIYIRIHLSCIMNCNQMACEPNYHLGGEFVGSNEETNSGYIIAVLRVAGYIISVLLGSNECISVKHE